MKKKYLIGLGIALASIVLSSCDSTNQTYGYPKDVVDGFYSFDAHFSNGTNKTYKLNKDINAKVIGNCLVCDYKDEYYNRAEVFKPYDLFNNSYYRFIIDIENNSFQSYTASTYYNESNDFSEGGLSKTVINSSNASIDRWLQENLRECFKIEEEFKSLEYSYKEESSIFNYDDGKWSDTTVTLCTSKFDNSGNKTLYQESIGSKVTYEEKMNYNDANQVVTKEEYIKTDWNTQNYLYEYTYDDANNLINEKKYYQFEGNTSLSYDHSYEYDKDNHLISEAMDYDGNINTELRWRSKQPSDYKKEYTYDGNKLKYEHDVYYEYDFTDPVSYEDEYYYLEEEIKRIRKEIGSVWAPLERTYTYALDGRILSIDTKDRIGEHDESHSFEQYEYDANLNLVKISSSMEYLDSELNELLHAGTHNEFYYYDSNNNLLKRISTYNYISYGKEKYTSLYQYDSDGFLLKKEEYAGLSNTFTYSFEWTGEGIEDIGFKENFKENK